MSSAIERFRNQKELISKRLTKYSRNAIRMIPLINKPRILGIGCGSEFATFKLARLIDSEIIRLDYNPVEYIINGGDLCQLYRCLK